MRFETAYGTVWMTRHSMVRSFVCSSEMWTYSILFNRNYICWTCALNDKKYTHKGEKKRIEKKNKQMSKQVKEISSTHLQIDWKNQQTFFFSFDKQMQRIVFRNTSLSEIAAMIEINWEMNLVRGLTDVCACFFVSLSSDSNLVRCFPFSWFRMFVEIRFQ